MRVRPRARASAGASSARVASQLGHGPDDRAGTVCRTRGGIQPPQVHGGEFAAQHGADRAFDDWEAMLDWDGVDAVYVATPTSVREEISLAAATRRKHVLAEKPFASLASVQRITRACREHDVAFMDGTHFVHHPRTQAVRGGTAGNIGWPWSLDSAFQFSMPDRSNIRFDSTLEPMGAIGDAGWYEHPCHCRIPGTRHSARRRRMLCAPGYRDECRDQRGWRPALRRWRQLDVRTVASIPAPS